jgi:hypothetical protein
MDKALVYNVQVLLTRELKSCTDFKNLNTLSLGEWCITSRFDVLAAMLGHSPNLEILFLHLDMVCIIIFLKDMYKFTEPQCKMGVLRQNQCLKEVLCFALH